MEPTGKKIAELRKTIDLSQSTLANSVGVSQATISRIESTEDEISDLKLLSKIARELGVTLNELISEESLNNLRGWSQGETFVAFCPNPFCSSNTIGLNKDESPFVQWMSSENYPADRFQEFNYCPECGEELIKECPNCKRHFITKRPRFCFTCGRKLCDRPTMEEWKLIKKKLELEKAADKGADKGEDKGEDIPF